MSESLLVEIGKQQTWVLQYHLATHSNKTPFAATVYGVEYLSREWEFYGGTCKLPNIISFAL